MKKLLTCLAAGVLTLAASTIAWAAPSFYLNPSYSMNSLQAVKVLDVENFSVAKSSDYQVCNHAEDLVMGGLYEAAGKMKLLVADCRNGDENTPSNHSAKMPSTIELRVTVQQMGTYQDLVPGYWMERTKEEEVEIWDKYKRKWVKGKIQRKYKEWVPERWRDNCEINLTYSVVDPTDGTVIAKSNDIRKRSDENDAHGMVRRSTKDFLKNLTKKK